MPQTNPFQVIFSAPFHTGIVLDFGTLLEHGYEGVQHEILKHFTKQTDLPGKWSIIDTSSNASDAPQPDMEQVLFDPARIRGRTAIPRYFLRYKCSHEHLDNVDHINRVLAEYQHDGLIFMIDSIRLRLYDFGFGSIVICLAGRSDQGHNLLGLKKFGETFEGRLNGLFGELISKVIAQFTQATNHMQDQEYKFENIPGRLLWTHRLFHLECSSVDLREFATSAANTIIDLQYSILEESNSSFVNSQNIRLYTGKGNSLVVTTKDSHFDDTSLGLPRLFSRVLVTGGVYDAVTESLHQKLLQSSNRVALDSDNGSIRQLQDVSGFIIKHTHFINHIKALRIQYKFSLDANSLAIWNAVDGAWEAHERWLYVEEQNRELEIQHSRIMADISRQQQRTLNLSVIFSLAVSILATVVGVMALFQQDSVHKLFLVLVSVVVISVATIGFWRRIYRS